MKPSTRTVLATVALFIASFYVVVLNHDEPYTQFRWSDARVQIGAASALITLWLMFSRELVHHVRRKALHRGWLSLGGLCAVALFYLYHAPVDYLSDLGYWGVVATQYASR